MWLSVSVAGRPITDIFVILNGDLIFNRVLLDKFSLH